MLVRVFSGAVIGLSGKLIEVEVDVASRGFPTFTIVGLPSKAVDEAKDRVRTALKNISFSMPESKLTVNLAPANLPKEGSSFDLPIAIGILAASGKLMTNEIEDSLFIGELSLKGNLRPVPAVLPIVLMAKEKKINSVFIPKGNAKEASLVKGINIYPVKNIEEIVLHLNGIKFCKGLSPLSNLEDKHREYEVDFSEIKGQGKAKRALEIAAAGFHNVHLKGSPGAGKTLLSRAFPSILPPMTRDEILEVTKIYSISGLLKENGGFIVERPFRSPHHTISRVGLIGGGSKPKPGEISLAHRGVLFLDEFPEFPRSVLEALRQPLEDGVVTVSRASGSLTFPARFLLVAASNPCPCGYLGHPTRACTCTPYEIAKYKKRLSGPILDRIDLHVVVPPVEKEELVSSSPSGKTSKEIRERVSLARERQKSRFKGMRIKTNGEMGSREVKNFIHLSSKVEEYLLRAFDNLSLSARGYFKVLKLARTIADLDSREEIEMKDVAEALSYRNVEG